MERFFKRASNELSSPLIQNERSKQSCVEIDLANLPSDPGEITKISDYHPNLRDEIRREYLLRGPCQPRSHQFVQTQCGEGKRRFVSDWFIDFPNWLEYSISKDAAFCLCCYLFKSNVGEQGGGDCFTGIGFRGHDESENSSNQGNFLQLLQFLVDHNDEVRAVALKKDIFNSIDNESIIQRFQNMAPCRGQL